MIDVPHRGEDVRYPIVVDPAYGWVDDGWLYLNPWVFADSGGMDSAPEQLWIGASGAVSEGAWGEWTYTPPGTAYVIEFSGNPWYDYPAPTRTLSGVRQSNGAWGAVHYDSDSPPPGTSYAYGCLIASCGAPVAGDAPTNNLSYFAGAQAVFRMEVTGTPASGGAGIQYFYVGIDDPDVPTLASVSSGAPGWIEGGTHNATANANDAGLGVKTIELIKAGVVVGHDDQPCAPEDGDCPQALAGSIAYNASALPEGITTYGLRAEDWLEHQSSVSNFDVKIDRTDPTVALSGSATLPLAPGNRLTIDSSDGSSAIARAGIRRLKIKVDGVAVPDVEITCTSGCPRTNQTHFDLDAGEYSEGVHTVTVRAEDDAGHLSSVATAVVYVLDLESVDRSKLGLENYFSYESTPTGADTAAHVNVANGNVVWHSTPIVNAGRGLASVVNLTYNSLDRGGYLGSLLDVEGTPIVGGALADLAGVAYGEAGIGFSLGISGVTRLNEPLSGVNAVTDPVALASQIRLTDTDGTRHVFTHTTGGKYNPPPGVELALRYQSSASTDKRWAATRPDGVTFYFDADGYQTLIVDRNANTIRYEYEKFSKVTGEVSDCTGTPLDSLLCSKRVVRVVDPAGVDAEPTPASPQGATAAGRSLHITYADTPMLSVGSGSGPFGGLLGPVGGAPGRITRIVDHARRVTDFTYDSAGYLTALTQGEVLASGGGASNTDDVRTIELAYSGSGPNRQLTTITDPREHATTIAYEAADDPGPFGEHSFGLRATSITNRRSNATTFAYDDDCFTATAPGGRDTAYCTDTAGRPDTISNDAGTVTELDWSSDNYLTNYRLAAGTADEAESTLTYTRLGDPLTISDPNAHVTSFTYEWGTEDGVTNAGVDDGTQYVADVMTIRRPQDASSSVPATVTYTRDSDGNITSRADGGYDAAEIHYPTGSKGLPDYELDEVDNKTSYADYDASGNPRTVVDPRQNAGESGYSSGTWRYTYDAAGNLLAVTDPRGSTNAAGQPYTTWFVYDAFDRVRESHTPRCSSTNTAICSSPSFIARTAVYDGNGNQTSATDGNGRTTTREFTAMDLPANALEPPSEHAGEEDPAGELTAYDYDARDNLTLVTSPNGTATETAATTQPRSPTTRSTGASAQRSRAAAARTRIS